MTDKNNTGLLLDYRLYKLFKNKEINDKEIDDLIEDIIIGNRIIYK